MTKLFDTVVQSTQEIAAKFENPGDDFVPIAFFRSESQIQVLPLIPFMENDTKKDMLAEVVFPMLVEKIEAIEVVTVFSAWILHFDKDEWDGETRPSESPDRVEVVVITSITAEGIQSNGMAYISRDPLGNEIPSLSDFDFEVGKRYEGRFIDPIIDALRKVES
jgi:hypothetical protein